MSAALPAIPDKPRFVGAMFGRIARRYDLMNTLMTLGMDAGWRRAVVSAARLMPGAMVLDVGTGTAKLARGAAAAAPGIRVAGADFSVPMLLAGGRSPGVALAAADGQCLPFGPGRFDAVISGFLLRNLADAAQGVREQVRVLAPGGRLVVLETTPGPSGVLGLGFRVYFRHVVPLIGGLVAGDRAAYTYLPESARAFLAPEKLADLLREQGLVDVSVRRLALGTVAITSGTKRR